MSGWSLTAVEVRKQGYELALQHLYPLDDDQPHVILRECACRPGIIMVIDDDGEPLGVLRKHRAWDGRE